MRFYDESKTYIHHWTLASGYGKTRTITYDQTSEAYYVGITTVDTSSPSDYYVINNNNIYKQANDELQNQVATVQANMDVLEGRVAIKNIINRFDKSTVSAGKYINISSGNLANSDGFFASDFIYIGDLDKVTVSYTHLFCWYDTSKNHITPNPDPMNSRSQDLSVTRPQDAVYLRFSAYNGDLELAQIGGAISRDAYTPYGIYKLTELRILESQIYASNDSQVVVDASGGGDYTSFTLACKEHYNDNKDIIVKAGTYDILSEYVAIWGQEAVDGMADADTEIFDGWQYGVKMNGRKFTFLPGAKLVLDWTDHTVNGTHRFSALRVERNVEIIGLDLDCTATFYAIHDDYGNNSGPYTVTYRNCRVIGHNLTNANCIGGGCKKWSRHIIDNCYFDNGLKGSATVRYHNTNAEGAEPEIYVSNTYFNNWFTPRWYGTQTSKMRVYVNNCEARAIYKMAESSSYNVDNVELYKWCNIETSPQN